MLKLVFSQEKIKLTDYNLIKKSVLKILSDPRSLAIHDYTILIPSILDDLPNRLRTEQVKTQTESSIYKIIALTEQNPENKKIFNIVK